MKAVVCHSGGLDSTTALALAVQQYGANEVLAISFDYGQRHKRELLSALATAQHLGVQRLNVRIDSDQGLFLGSSQSDASVSVPEGHYADPSMRITVVPNRNMVMLSLAAAAALSYKASEVWFAAHAGDHPVYPDCRPEFVEKLNAALTVANYEPITITAPFINVSKAIIVEIGARINAPLALTWSCYKGQTRHCGKCGTCVERIEAFKLAGVEDLTTYE